MIAALTRQSAQFATYQDALVRRVQAELKMWTDWLTANNVRGYMGEIGWPYDTDQARWANLARTYYKKLRSLDVIPTPWAASGHFHAYSLAHYADGGSVRVLDTTRPNSRVAEQFASRTSFAINLPEADFGAGTLSSNGGLFSNFNPGTVGTDYFYPPLGDLQFLAARGIKLLRFSFMWERLQPTLGAALNTAELGRIQTFLSNCQTAGLKAIITPHNFAGYKIGTSNTAMTQYYLTTDTTAPLHINHFTDFWQRLSAALSGNPAVYAYDLMNEPTGITAIAGPFGPNFIANPTFETDVSGWTAGSGTSIAASSIKAHSGAKSLAVTATAAGTPSTFNTASFAVTAGNDYAASLWVSAGATPRGCRITLDWKTSGGVFISSASSATLTDNTSGWIQLAAAGTAPPTAAKANLTFKAPNAALNEVHYIDDVTVQASTNQSSQQIWQTITQSALNTIRANADTTLIMVPGYNYSRVDMWQSLHPNAWITDPANNIRYEAHHYWDADYSGTYSQTYAQILAAAVAAGY